MKKHSLLLRLSLLLLGCALTLCASSMAQPKPGPVQTSSASALSGEVLFHEKGCEYCHGVNGVGIQDKAPSLLTVGKRLTKEAIAKQIHDGGKSMPAFGEALQPDEITALVDMLSRKKKAPRGSAANIPSPPATLPSQQVNPATDR